MANKRVTELPVLSEWADDDEVLVTDVSDVDSVPESSPDGTLKRTTFADLKDETTAAALAAGDSQFVNTSGDVMDGELQVGTAVRVWHPSASTKFAFIETAGGTLYFQRQDVNNVNQGNDAYITSSGLWNITKALAVGKPTAVGQAARISAYNAATGQYQLDGIEHGRTGIRDVTSLLINGWTAAKIHISRVGNYVEVMIDNLNGTAATSPSFLNLPVGWQWPDSSHPIRAFVGNTGSPPSFWRLSASTQLSIPTSYTTAAGIYDSFRYETQLSWPSTLPGTPITAPYTLPV